MLETIRIYKKERKSGKELYKKLRGKYYKTMKWTKVCEAGM